MPNKGPIERVKESERVDETNGGAYFGTREEVISLSKNKEIVSPNPKTKSPEATPTATASNQLHK